MAVDFNKAAALFKEVAPEAVQEQFYRKYVLLDQIDKNERDIEIGEPSYARIPLLIGENPAVGARGFRAVLPAGDIGEYETAKVRLKYLYAQLICPGQFLKAKSNPAAFVSFLQQETANLGTAARRDFNRQLHGDGRGVLAVPTAGVGPALAHVVDSVKFLSRRMLVDVIERDTGTVVAAARTIVSIDPSTNTVTFDANVTIPAGPTVTAIYRAGARNVELTGFAAMISDANPALGNYQDVNATTITEWRAFLKTAANAPISDALLQSVIDGIDQQSGSGDDMHLMLTSHAQRAKFIALLQQDRQFTNTLDLRGGHKVISWNNNGFIVDRDCEARTVWFINPKFLRLYRMSDWEFMEEDGSRLFRDPAGTDAYLASMFKYAELGCLKRAAMGKLHTLEA